MFFFLVGVDVMQVAHHWFENGISHFTRRINKCISMGMFSFVSSLFITRRPLLMLASYLSLR